MGFVLTTHDPSGRMSLTLSINRTIIEWVCFSQFVPRTTESLITKIGLNKGDNVRMNSNHQRKF